MSNSGYGFSFQSGPEPMEIGNVEIRPYSHGKAMQNNPSACEKR